MNNAAETNDRFSFSPDMGVFAGMSKLLYAEAMDLMTANEDTTEEEFVAILGRRWGYSKARDMWEALEG